MKKLVTVMCSCVIYVLRYHTLLFHLIILAWLDLMHTDMHSSSIQYFYSRKNCKYQSCSFHSFFCAGSFLMALTFTRNMVAATTTTVAVVQCNSIVVDCVGRREGGNKRVISYSLCMLFSIYETRCVRFNKYLYTYIEISTLCVL